MSSDQSKLTPLDPTSKSRKSDHIEMAFESQITPQSIDDRFYYEPLLSGHPDKSNSASFRFLDVQFTLPIWVSSMTGGTAYAGIINKNLARACNEFGFGMGLGSCRALLHDQETFEDFNVRDIIGDRALYANLGIAQIDELIQNAQLNKAVELVKSLQANGLIIHINPMQEWLQPEGDHIARPPIDIIKNVLDKIDTKIIIKEVGQGMGYESLKALFQLPLEAIDFAANGGTNFAKLEMHRASEAVQNNYKKIANLGHSANEMVDFSNKIIDELGSKRLCEQVIVSGGVQDFLDGYYFTEKLKVSAIYGQASAFLKYAREDYEQLRQYVEAQASGLRLAQAFLKIKES